MKLHIWPVLLAVVLAGTACDKAPPVSSDANPRPAPEFPRELARIGAQGTTVLLITVDAVGAITAIEVEKSAGYEQFDQAAVEAARGWRMPAPENGARKARMRVPVHFRYANPDKRARKLVANRPLPVEKP